MWCMYGVPPFVLSPAHAAVFRIAAATLSDFVGWKQSEDDWPGAEVPVFDNLSQNQKQAAILAVARALLDPTLEPPKVTAALAGTVDAIYHQLETFIELEISFGEETAVRKLLL